MERIILQALLSELWFGKGRQFFPVKDYSILILTYLRIRSPTIWQNNGSIKNHPWDLGDVLEIHKSLSGVYWKNKDRTCTAEVNLETVNNCY